MFAAKEYVRLVTPVGSYPAGTVAVVVWMDSARDECVVRFADGCDLTVACSALAAADEPAAPILLV